MCYFHSMWRKLLWLLGSRTGQIVFLLRQANRKFKLR